MKKLLVGLLVLVAVAGAQDASREDRLDQIKKLEARAERLLDAGQRAEAFDALARAAVLRDLLKKSPKAEPKPKRGAKTDAPATKRRPTEVQRASAALAKAVDAGNMEGVKRAARRLQRAAAAAEKRHREERKRLEARLNSIERQIAALKKLLDG